MATLNLNDHGIVLSYEASTTSVNFLDLEVMVVEQHLEFRTYFKPTDRNGYIPVNSCHQSQWLKSVPHSQFLRLRRNCTRTSDFLAQSRVLKNRFVEKGYNCEVLDFEINKVLSIERSSTLVERPREGVDSRYRCSFFTTYSTQSKQIREIFKKHWKVLQSDRLLGPVLPECAGVIFRGARSIQGQVALNMIDPPKKL